MRGRCGHSRAQHWGEGTASVEALRKMAGVAGAEEDGEERKAMQRGHAGGPVKLQRGLRRVLS